MRTKTCILSYIIELKCFMCFFSLRLLSGVNALDPHSSSCTEGSELLWRS